MANPDLPDLDADEHEVREGRTFGYTIVGDWVLLNPDISDRAVRIYCLLRMHCKGGKRQAHPAQTTLAHMLGIKKTDAIGKAIQELVGIGAVEIEVTKHKSGRRNTYVVNEAPPPAYDQGPIDRTAYYDARKRERAAEGVPPVSGVTPKSGVMGDPGSRGDGSPPKRGSEVVQEEGLQGDEDQKIKRSADAPSPQAATDDDDPWSHPCFDGEPLPPPNYKTEPKEWLEYKAYGFEAGEEPMVDSMLDRGVETKAILAKIFKDRYGDVVIERSAIRGDWRPYVKWKVGGWRKGEYDYARKLLADYHPDIVVEELLCARADQHAA